jgi:hypothetical protein
MESEISGILDASSKADDFLQFHVEIEEYFMHLDF